MLIPETRYLAALNRTSVDDRTAFLEERELIRGLYREQLTAREGADHLVAVGIYEVRCAPERGLLPGDQPYHSNDLDARGRVVGPAGLAVRRVQGKARQVYLTVALVDHREVLYAAPLSVSSTWPRITSTLLEFPDVRARKIEQCVVEDAPLDVPLEQGLDDVLFAARRDHRHERRVADLKLYGKRPVFALV